MNSDLDYAYLDYNASAPLRPEAAAALTAALGEGGNPSSVHRAGRQARRMVERAREKVAALVGAAADAVIFTSGATEANHLALSGLGDMSGVGARALVLASAVEHPSVLAAVPAIVQAPVDGQGVVDLAALEAALAAAVAAGRPYRLVALMLANNETGVLQPVAAAAALAHRYGALLHGDAVQAVGRIAVDMVALGCDSLSLSAHKIGGPQGVGALVLRPGLKLDPALRGGGQEGGRRAGTENVAGIAGFGAAAAAVMEKGRDEIAAQGAWRDEIEQRIRAVAPGLGVPGAEASRLANTT